MPPCHPPASPIAGGLTLLTWPLCHFPAWPIARGLVLLRERRICC